jgi:hypothetical protein
MTIAVDRTRTGAFPMRLLIVGIPFVFVVLGLMLRYAAYATLIDDAHLSAFADFLCRWDCAWYLGIVEKGYDPFPVPTMINAGNWAFFPLFPMTVAGLSNLTGLPPMNVAMMTSVLLTWAAAVISWPLFDKNLRAYVLYSAFLLCGPFSMYFTTFFTEVMFVLFIICVFVALKNKQYLAAGVFAALLSATRIVGVFIVFAIVLQIYLDHRERGGTLKSLVTGIWKRPDLLLAIFIAPLGLFIYMAFLYFHIGDALAFSHVQIAWGRTTGNPVTYVWNALTNVPESGFWPTVSQQLGLAAVVGLALTIVLVVRRQYPAAVFCAVCIGLPLFAGMGSMVRFVVALAPIVITLMLLLSRWRVTFFATLALFIFSSYYVTMVWTQGHLSLV